MLTNCDVGEDAKRSGRDSRGRSKNKNEKGKFATFTDNFI